jgi:hypothetical protein
MMASPFRSGRAPGSLARRIDHRAAPTQATAGDQIGRRWTREFR